MSNKQDSMPPTLKAAIIGAVIGAAGVGFLGFAVAGWTTHSSAEGLAKQRAHAAVVDALAPICADNFRTDADAAKHLADLGKTEPALQGNFIAQGGWAKMPGSPDDADVAKACATMVNTKS